MFTELHNHTFFSVMDGYNSPRELVVVGKALGHKAMGITDHGTLSGVRDFQKACIDEGIKPVIGCEMYISATDRFDRRPMKKREDNTQAFNHLIVHAKNQKGLENLQAMSENAWSEGFYYKPRIDKELLTEYREGLIVLSGCMNGLVAKALTNDDDAEARKWMKYFSETFGDDFYVEIQPHNPHNLNAGLAKLAEEFGAKQVVTNDCHFAEPKERSAEEVMLILSTNPADSGKFYNDVKHLEFFDMLDALYPDRGISFADLDLFLKSEDDVYKELCGDAVPSELGGKNWPRDLIEATQEIVEKVEDYQFYQALDLLPHEVSDTPIEVRLPEGVQPNTDDSILAHLAYNGLYRLGLKNPLYVNRVKEELKTITDLNFSKYFLIVEDVMAEAKRRGILCGPGRGSSAGSLVCYALGITDVDPIEHGLLFFRFLDPDRGDWPDIDMDFPDDRRHEMIEYMREKYGNVAYISTYGYFRDKAAIKSVARALRVPYNEVMAMAKTIDTFEEYEAYAELPLSTNMDNKVTVFHNKYPLVLHFAQRLRGKINTVGLHPAGIVVANEPIERYAPVEYRKDTQTDERIPAIVQDMEGAEDIGLIKFDFLGLKTLSVVARACELAGVQPPRRYDDKAVLQEYIKGHTVGIFQAEQSAYTKLLRQMDERTFTFADLVASNALVRPGAMNTVGKEYLARRAGHEPVVFDHKDMRSITAETFGVLIYQEQLMQAAVALGGFSMPEANKLRRIIGKKKDIAEFKPFEDKWMENASKVVGITKATKLWGDFQAHAGYSFNKSHAVAYSMLSYWTMWLKYYYPLEFLTAALAAEKTAANNPKWSKLMLETKRLGIDVLLPHVNLSEAKPTVHNGQLLLGLTHIKYIGDKAAKPLLAARPFGAYSELLELSTTKGSGVSTRVMDALNKLNAASFKDNPKRAVSEHLYDYIGIPSFVGVDLKHPERVTPLEDFEETGAYVVQGLVQKIKRGKGWSRVEVLDETGTQGIFHDEATQITEGTFYTFLVAANRIVDWLDGEDDKQIFARWLSADKLPGNLCLAVAPRTTKAGKEMATAVFSDPGFNLTGALIFPGTYAKLKTKVQAGRILKPFIGEMDDGGYMLKGLD